MKHVARILDVRFSENDRPRFPISWSNSYIETLRNMANNIGTIRSPLDDQLASMILLCVDGQFAEAESRIITLLHSNVDLIKKHHETFISFLFALYASQQLTLLAAMLHDRYGYEQYFSIDVEENGPGQARVRWDILPDGTHRFVFDAKSYQHDYTRSDILAFQWGFPLYANYSKLKDIEPGSVIINQGDVGQTPGLAWCDNRPNYFLVPDCIFVPSRGYNYAREILTKNYVPWEERKPIAFWRGATTGVPTIAGDWRSLERVKLAEIGNRYEHRGFIDAGLSSVIQFSDPVVVEEIKNSGLFRGFVPWENWGQFKYHIDIDGNSSPWSNLFQRLLAGSTVLKVESRRALNQWFYDKLVPWENYVPIAPDLSDLIEKIDWLTQNDQYAREIGQAGRSLADRLTYDREVERSARTIAAAFKYFRGERNCCGPFGRPLPASSGN
jgi:hypothetical protein